MLIPFFYLATRIWDSLFFALAVTDATSPCTLSHTDKSLYYDATNVLEVSKPFTTNLLGLSCIMAWNSDYQNEYCHNLCHPRWNRLSQNVTHIANYRFEAATYKLV